MLGNLISQFLNPLNPVNRSCCCVEDGRCSDSAALNEILDEAHSGDTSILEVLVEGKNMRGSLPRGPKARLMPTFATRKFIVLEGEPLYEGNILQLVLGESIQEVRLSLHVNGFRVKPLSSVAEPGAEEIVRTWSPFSLIEKCQVKTMQHASMWAVFKITMFRTECTDDMFYFATSGLDAQPQRDQWMAQLAYCINQVTASVFPAHAIAVQPMPWVPMTITRIMAGYLLQSMKNDNVIMMYCELHAYQGGEARMTIYKDEWCDLEMTSILLADTSVVSTRKGEYCTVFGVDDHRFCARTKDEKELWLRAVSNIKVKLMFDAPDPTAEEMSIFRDAIQERLELINGPFVGRPVVSAEQSLPLLQQVHRLPDIISPRGDVLNPEPIDDAAECSPQPELDTSGHDISLDTSGLTAWLGSGAVDLLRPEECRQLVQGMVINPFVKDEPGLANVEAINPLIKDEPGLANVRDRSRILEEAFPVPLGSVRWPAGQVLRDMKDKPSHEPFVVEAFTLLPTAPAAMADSEAEQVHISQFPLLKLPITAAGPGKTGQKPI